MANWNYGIWLKKNISERALASVRAACRLTLFSLCVHEGTGRRLVALACENPLAPEVKQPAINPDYIDYVTLTGQRNDWALDMGRYAFRKSRLVVMKMPVIKPRDMRIEFPPPAHLSADGPNIHEIKALLRQVLHESLPPTAVYGFIDARKLC